MLGHLVVAVGLDRKSGEDGIAIIAALERNVLLEDHLHSCQPRQLCWLINLVGPAGISIDFLKRHQVRLDRFDHAANSWQVENAVDSLAMMNVVAEYPDSEWLSGSKLQSGEEEWNEGQQGNESRVFHRQAPSLG